MHVHAPSVASIHLPPFFRSLLGHTCLSTNGAFPLCTKIESVENGGGEAGGMASLLQHSSSVHCTFEVQW